MVCDLVGIVEVGLMVGSRIGVASCLSVLEGGYLWLLWLYIGVLAVDISELYVSLCYCFGLQYFLFDFVHTADGSIVFVLGYW